MVLRALRRLASNLSARKVTARPQSPRAHLRLEQLEERTLLSIGELPVQDPLNFAAMLGASGVSSDAAKVFVAGTNSDPINTKGIIQAYNPSTGQTIGTPVPSPAIPLTSVPGTICTVPSGANLHYLDGVSAKAGDQLMLVPEGGIWSANPTTGFADGLFGLKTLVSKSTGSPSWTVDNTDIYDVFVGYKHNFGGVIIPETANTVYNDFAIYVGADFTDIFVSGISSLPFVLRVRFVNGQFSSAKVLASSTGTVGGDPSPGSQICPVAVNNSGVVLTALPVFDTRPDFTLAVFTPIAFDDGFPEGEGRSPFQPFAFDNNAPLSELS